MTGKVSSSKVYHVDGLPDETFETEADAATASILVMMGANGNNWDILQEGLINNLAEIQKQIQILMEPRNAKSYNPR
jgi:hypothetical protein